VLEDSPYRQLRYLGEDLPSLLELDRDGRVISLRTFSKILSPGLRLGWIAAHPEVVSRLVVAKQAADLCTGSLVQIVVREFLKAGLLPGLILRNRELYAEKRVALLSALEAHFDPAWGVHWTRPEGGLFVWVTLPVWMDAAELFQRALAENVAFVVGGVFHCDGSGRNTLRLNFSHPRLEQLRRRPSRPRACRAPGATLWTPCPGTSPSPRR
jgi:2-aminoadipate transaminase